MFLIALCFSMRVIFLEFSHFSILYPLIIQLWQKSHSHEKSWNVKENENWFPGLEKSWQMQLKSQAQQFKKIMRINESVKMHDVTVCRQRLDMNIEECSWGWSAFMVWEIFVVMQFLLSQIQFVSIFGSPDMQPWFLLPNCFQILFRIIQHDYVMIVLIVVHV